MVFAAYNVCRMIFKGGVLGGARNIHHDPYLNGTTVPFDIKDSNPFGSFIVIMNSVNL